VEEDADGDEAAERQLQGRAERAMKMERGGGEKRK